MNKCFPKYTADGERDESMNYGRKGKAEPQLFGPLVVNSEFHELDGTIVIYEDDDWCCPAHERGEECPACEEGISEELCVDGYAYAIVWHLPDDGPAELYNVEYEDLRDLDEDELALYELSKL